ncbi:MAG: TlpA disulfide reductase family protein [Archangium sp.]
MKQDRITWIFVALLLIGAAVMGWQEVTAEILPGGSDAPLFIADNLEGGKVTLSELKGKVVVVNFWATWCPPCREEMPYLLSLVKEREANGVVLVAVNNDDLDGQREAVTNFVRQYPDLKKWVALGRPEIGMAYQVEALPSVYVLDRKGRLVASHRGQATESQLRRWIEKAMETN